MLSNVNIIINRWKIIEDGDSSSLFNLPERFFESKYLILSRKKGERERERERKKQSDSLPRITNASAAMQKLCNLRRENAFLHHGCAISSAIAIRWKGGEGGVPIEESPRNNG